MGEPTWQNLLEQALTAVDVLFGTQMPLTHDYNGASRNHHSNSTLNPKSPLQDSAYATAGQIPDQMLKHL
jgi:hypothetical protein